MSVLHVDLEREFFLIEWGHAHDGTFCSAYFQSNAAEDFLNRLPDLDVTIYYLRPVDGPQEYALMAMTRKQFRTGVL